MTTAGQMDLLELLEPVPVPPPEPAMPAVPAPSGAPAPTRGPSGGTTGPGAAWLRTVAHWPDHSRVTWTAPWDTVPGVHAGDVLPAYRCPHCRQIEAGEYALAAEHGVEFHRPETWRDQAAAGAWQECARQRLTERQARVALGRGLQTYRCRYCQIWTCEQLVNTTAHDGPYECAGERAGHDWRPEVPAAGPA